MIRVILGAPASGKSSLVESLTTDATTTFGVRRFFEEAVERATPLGLLARPYVERQAWLPDELVIRAIGMQLDAGALGPDTIFEGVPATRRQAELLDEALAARGLRLEQVIHLRADDDVLKRRAAGRLVCMTCDHGSHPVTLGEDGRCSGCGGRPARRTTDGETAFERRLAEHEANGAGLVEHYGERLLTVDTSRLDPTEVARRVPR